MRVSHNPESPIGDRGNGPETRPGGEWRNIHPRTSEPPKGNPRPEGREGGQHYISFENGEKVIESTEELYREQNSYEYC